MAATAAISHNGNGEPVLTIHTPTFDMPDQDNVPIQLGIGRWSSSNVEQLCILFSPAPTVPNDVIVWQGKIK